jgi:hypothetical protein
MADRFELAPVMTAATGTCCSVYGTGKNVGSIEMIPLEPRKPNVFNLAAALWEREYRAMPWYKRLWLRITRRRFIQVS